MNTFIFTVTSLGFGEDGEVSTCACLFSLASQNETTLCHTIAVNKITLYFIFPVGLMTEMDLKFFSMFTNGNYHITETCDAAHTRICRFLLSSGIGCLYKTFLVCQ